MVIGVVVTFNLLGFDALCASLKRIILLLVSNVTLDDEVMMVIVAVFLRNIFCSAASK